MAFSFAEALGCLGEIEIVQNAKRLFKSGSISKAEYRRMIKHGGEVSRGTYDKTKSNKKDSQKVSQGINPITGKGK